MTLKDHLAKNINLATPVVIGQLGHIAVGVADSVMVGDLGVVPLAGATFANSIFYVLFLFGIGVSNALTPLVAATEIKDKPRLFSLLQNNLLLNGGLGILLFVLAIGSTFFLDAFGQEEAVVKQAEPYMKIISASIIPVMFFQSFRQYSEGLSNTISPMMVSILGNLVNIGLNYLLIYGKLGAPAMGLNGAGLASMISRIFMLALMILMTKKLWWGITFQFSKQIIKKQINLGLPLGFQYIFEFSAFATASIMIGWLGAEELAAHQIAINMAAVTYMAATGIATAASIRVGNQLGRKDKKNLRMAAFSSYGLVVAFMILCGLMFILFRNYLPTLYIDDQRVIQIASSLLITGAAFQISDGIQSVGLGVLRGLTDVKFPTIVTFVAYWLFAVPMAYVFGFVFNWGIAGIWYALLVGLTASGVLNLRRFIKLSNKLVFED